MSTLPHVRADGPVLVSIVTIFFDAGAFLDEAVASVLAQTYEHWELLLVDDGSTDASREAARRWADRHPARIRYLEHPGHQNRGMSASRNLGVRHARGEVLAFLDADDVYLPDKLMHQVRLLADHPEVGMVYGATEYWYGWTGEATARARDRTRRQGVAPGIVPPPALLAPLVRDEARTPCTCGVLLRRAAFERADGFEERFRGMYEDQAFFYKIFARVPVLVDDRVLDRYRQHAGSHVHTQEATGAWARHAPSPARAEFLRWLDAFVAAEGLADAALRRAIRRELRPYASPLLGWVYVARHHARARLRGARRRLGAWVERARVRARRHEAS